MATNEQAKGMLQLAETLEQVVVPYERALKLASEYTTSELSQWLTICVSRDTPNVERRAMTVEAERRIQEAEKFIGGHD